MDDLLHSTKKPLLTIRPTSGWQAINFRELWQFRDLLMSLAMRDVKLRYKQTALGVLWVILQPLISAGIFSFVFGRVAKLPSDGVPYFVFAYAGLLAWNAFNSTLGKISSCLVGNAHLVSKVYFPRLVLPFSTLFSTLLDFGVALLMLGALMAVYHVRPGPGLVLLPLWLLSVLLLATGIGLLASALMVSYRDIQYILPVVTQFLMYASPVAYSVTAVPMALRPLYFLNPLSGLLEAFRWSLLNRGMIHWNYLLYSLGFSLAAFVMGAYAFKKMEKKFADVI